MPSRDPEENARGIIIPKMVFWGLVMPLLCSVVGGTWWMATLAQTITNQGSAQVSLSARMADVERTVQNNKDLSAASVGSISDRLSNATGTINDRLTRMEAQLSFLVNTAGPHK